MEAIKIHTGLDKFLLLDRIIEYSDAMIIAERRFSKNEKFLAIEAAAQLASYHVRLKLNCEKHAFLLKVERFKYNTSEDLLSGILVLNAELKGETDRSFSYDVTGKKNGEVFFQGSVIIATSDDSATLNADQFKPYYQNSLRCLLKNTEKK